MRINTLLATLIMLSPVTAFAQVAVPEYDDVPVLDTTDEEAAAPQTRYFRSSSTNAIAPENPRATRTLTPVGRHRFQMETAFDYRSENDTGPKSRQYAFPTTLRFGLSERVEVQIEGNMYTRRTGGNTAAENGFGDLFFGSKWWALEGGGLLPSVGVAAMVGLPTGSDNVSGNAIQPEAETILHWDLPAEFILDGTVGVDVPPKKVVGDRLARVTYGAAVQRPLPILRDRLNAFVEFTGKAPMKANRTDIHQMATGIGMRLTDNMQLATFGRFGLNKAAPDVQTGIGFNWRL
jgi:hypothetical protein